MWRGSVPPPISRIIPSQWLIRQFEERMMVLSDTTSHAAEGDPTNLKLCQHGEWQDRILIAAENAGPPGHRMEGGVSTVEMATPLDLISKVVFSSWLHDLWTTFGRLMRSQITSTISTVWNFTTRSGGICSLYYNTLRWKHVTGAALYLAPC